MVGGFDVGCGDARGRLNAEFLQHSDVTNAVMSSKTASFCALCGEEDEKLRKHMTRQASALGSGLM